jgi:tetratricopeptide (TPR) repeat protein
MATGALSTTSRRMPGQGAMNPSDQTRALAADDAAKIRALLQAASRVHQSGDADRLKTILEEILEIDPNHPNATYNLGILYRDRDEIYQAEIHLRRAIRLDPKLIDAYQALADLMFSVKHLLPAAQLYEEALGHAPNRLSLLHNLAKTRMMLKDAPEAERWARRILSIDDKSEEAWATLAWALLFRGGDPIEALEAAEQAVRFASDLARAPSLKEHALRRCGRIAEADESWSALLSKAAQSWESARALIEGYYWLDQLDKCRAVSQAFVDANPDGAEGLKDLAALLMAEGDFTGAQELLVRATALTPSERSIRMVRGLNAFRLGNYKEGLELYEARWHRSVHDKPWDIPVPEWDGRPLDGRLIVYSEQGIGDYAMFALMFSDLRKHARSVTIEVNARIASLFRRSFPDMPVIDRNMVPANWNPAHYQAKVAMGDLFLRLGADMENLPNRFGFLIPEPALALKLRNRYRAMFPGKRLIGISWRSGNRDSATIRSIDLNMWRPILETPDCAFISLQYGSIARDLEALQRETGHVVHWDNEVDPTQFLDPFTAQIAAMDLVISVDNSTVHFAGAIGKPCWVMLPVNSDWRWLAGRTSSIWYDSLHLWRQQKGEGWEPVVAKVADHLRAVGTEPLIDAQADLCLRCGEEMLRREAMGPAEDYFRWLLETGRHKAAAFHGVGMAAQKARHHQDAVAILGRAAELAPERIDYKADWAVGLFEAGHCDAGERLARELTRRGNDPTALMAMGQILASKGLLDQATDYFARVLRSDPAHTVARAILGGLQAAQGEDELARRNFSRLVEQAPDLPGPRTALAEIELRHGRDEDAWPNFAWRFGTAPEELPRHLAMIAPDERPKSWTGGRIRRRRLFLRAERSLLEQLLFAPWFADAVADSRMVRAECDSSSLPLLSAAFPDVRFAGAGSVTPADLIADRAQIAASLADIAASYPRNPDSGWLPWDRADAAARRSRLAVDRSEVRIVGLAWQPTASAGAGLETFAPLFDTPGVRWVALPLGNVTPALAQLLSAPDCPLVFESNSVRDGLGSLCGLLAALDLLISAEDLAATLAGAMGKPVWKFAGPNAHWSWGASGAGSKWHPTARILRAAGGTESLIAAASADLVQFGGR